MPIRTIPGAVTRTTVRGLIISSETSAPRVLMKDTNGRALPVTVTPLTTSAALRDALRAFGDLRLYEFQRSGLDPDTWYYFTPHNGTDFSSYAHVRTLSETSLQIVLASCYYDGFNRGASYEAAMQKHAGRMHLKILAGDNVYADVWKGQRSTSEAYAHLAEVYGRNFWRSSYADVLSHGGTLTTWDDHEFWNNFPQWQAHLSRTWGGNAADYKAASRECLRYFQAVLNQPLPRPGEVNPLSNYSYAFDTPVVDFFFADIRVNRTLHHDRVGRMLHPNALAQFRKWAKTNTGKPGVLVIGQPLWLEDGGFTDYGPPDFADEYAAIWKALRDAPRDIAVLSGDVHHSRVLKIELGHNRATYEIVSSPASHIPTEGSIALGSYRNQGHGTLSAPKSVGVQVADGDPSPVRPKLAEYIVGTDVTDTIAVLDFERAEAGRDVWVGVKMIDLATGDVAKTKPIDFGRQTWSTRNIQSRCNYPAFAKLRAERPAR